MGAVRGIFTLFGSCLWWAALFAVCRVAAWLAGRPAWHCVPAGLGLGLLWLCLKSLVQRSRRDPDGDALAPEAAESLRIAWERGGRFLSGRFFRRRIPRLLFLDIGGRAHTPFLELGDAADTDNAIDGQPFTWRLGPAAVWLECPDTPERDGGIWKAFARLTGRERFDGVVVSLDAGALLRGDVAGAHILKTRLEALQRRQRPALPVYLFIDGIDRVYGLRSLVSRLDPETAADPLGAIRDQSRENSPAFFRRVLVGCGDALVRAAGDPQNAAAILAPAELSRLADPLIGFCRVVFHKGGGKAPIPWIRGLFLAAASPGDAPVVPPSLAHLPTFRQAEETLAVQPWFLRTALRTTIPGDLADAAGARDSGFRRACTAQAAGLAVGALSLCLLLTCSYIETRSVLLSTRGHVAPPSHPDGLGAYLELATLARVRTDDRLLPRFGMNQADDLADELTRRYAESYFDLKTVPGMERVQDAAMEAARCNDPLKTGNALLLLAVTREGLSRSIDNRAEDAHTRLLHRLANSLDVVDSGDMRQLEAFFAWAGGQDWMPDTRDALVRFEKYLVDAAAGGDLSWLPAWIDSLPDLEAVDASRIWGETATTASHRQARIPAAWTAAGYLTARDFLDAVVYDADNAPFWREKREEFLARYRRSALAHWKAASTVLWKDFRKRIADRDVQRLARQAARGDDPAARFAAQARAHLLPMFETDDSPDVSWLRLLLRLEDSAPRAGGGTEGLGDRLAAAVREFGNDDTLDNWARAVGMGGNDGLGDVRGAWTAWRNALGRCGGAAETPPGALSLVRGHFRAGDGGTAVVGPDDPFREAGEAAALLHARLGSASGGSSWDALSPLATYDYFRYLATRQAALHLDALWRETVYNPAHLTPGTEDDRRLRLAADGGPLSRFLAETASGLWNWSESRLVNARWSGLSFMFDTEFLAYCADTLRAKHEPRPASLELPFAVRAVHVDADAAERPVAVEFVLATGGREQKIVFNNFRIADTFTCHAGDGEPSAAIRIVFPSVTASLDFSGMEGVAVFVSLLSKGEARLKADLFADASPELRRMKITAVTLKAKLDNGEALAAFLAPPPFMLPKTVITHPGNP